MTRSGLEQPKTEADYFDVFQKKRVYMTTNIIFISLFTVLGFTAMGYGIDILLGTKPFVMVVLLLVSFPLNQIIIIRKLKKDL